MRRWRQVRLPDPRGLPYQAARAGNKKVSHLSSPGVAISKPFRSPPTRTTCDFFRFAWCVPAHKTAFSVSFCLKFNKISIIFWFLSYFFSMILNHVANLHQAGIVLQLGKTSACEIKIMMIFVSLTVPDFRPKSVLSQVCVAINTPAIAKVSWLMQICDYGLLKTALANVVGKKIFKYLKISYS